MKKSMLVLIVGLLVIMFVFVGYATEMMDSNQPTAQETEYFEYINQTHMAEGQMQEGQSNAASSEILEPKPEYTIPEAVTELVTEKIESNKIQQFEGFIKEFSVPEVYVEQILALVEQGYSLRDIMVLYDFLEDNFGSMDELESMLAQKKAGANFVQLFDAYIVSKQDYTQKDFPEGEIDRLLSYQFIDIEDILVADIMAQEANVPFDDIMGQLTQGKGWQEVAVSVNMLTCDGEADTIAISNEEIEQYAEQNTVSVQKAAKYVAMEKEAGGAQTKTNSRSKMAQKSPVQALADYLEEKYN